MAILLGACDSGKSVQTTEAEKILNIYNWADYIAPGVVESFESEFRIHVNYDTYDSTQIADVKMLAGGSGYDVVVYSNQYASRLAPIGVFEKLDFSRFDNYRHLDKELMQKIDLYEVVRNYHLPYHWGTTGYTWNVEMVRERLPDHPMDSGDVLFDPEVVSKLADCGVSLLDGVTDLFPMVLAYLGRDPNAVDDENLAAAEAQLKLVRPYIRYFSNEKLTSDLPNKEICLAMSWSGDYMLAQDRAREAGIDIDLRYTMPKEGSGLWAEGLYIPSDAPHKNNAYLFLDFMMRPDIAALNANFTSYPNLNKASREFMRPDMLTNPAVFPDDTAWERIYPVLTVDPKRERPRTRAFARVKSGI